MALIDEAKSWANAKILPKVKGIHRVDQLQSNGAVIQFDVHCLVTTKTGTTIMTQPVNYFNEEFSLGGNREVKNYEAEVSEKSEDEKLLEKFIAIEADVGTQVKVDPAFLDKLGIKYLVYLDPTDGKKKATTELKGIRITREVG